MDTTELAPALAALFSELIEGPRGREAYMLNPGDRGLLRSLDRLSAEAASTLPLERPCSIAAQTDHVRYSLELANRWADGDSNPFADADWSRSWQRTEVTEEEWDRLRSELRDEAERWREALERPREVDEVGLKGMIAVVAHLAYHVGAMRQIDHSLRGPRDQEAAALSRASAAR